MNEQKNISSRILQKQKLRDKRLKNLADRLKSNIAKRKKTKRNKWISYKYLVKQT